MYKGTAKVQTCIGLGLLTHKDRRHEITEFFSFFICVSTQAELTSHLASLDLLASSTLGSMVGIRGAPRDTAAVILLGG
jgi:hypothetical protein